jgi:hypothetical protein
MIWVSNLVMDKRFFSSPKCPTDSGIHPCSYSMGSGILSWGKVAREWN